MVVRVAWMLKLASRAAVTARRETGRVQDAYAGGDTADETGKARDRRGGVDWLYFTDSIYLATGPKTKRPTTTTTDSDIIFTAK